MNVFVSSPTKDLGEARKKVCERLLQLGIKPVSMGCYTADGRPPKKVDEAKVKECAGFVLIIGHLYGSSPDREDKSFTELEYEAAIEAGMEVYAFLASEDKFPVLPSLREDDITHKKLQAFRKQIGRAHV